MNISVSQAAKQWQVSRTTIYKKIDAGELSRNSDRNIDTTEMLRVFGNPPKTEQHEQPDENVQKTSVNNENVQLKHQLDIEKLKNDYLRQQVSHQKELIESYQRQIEQLSKSLDKANTSLQDFAQTKLLELKHDLAAETNQQSERMMLEATNNPKHDLGIDTKKKKSWWRWTN